MKDSLHVSLTIVILLVCPFWSLSQNVGIGTSFPKQKLHVEGSTYIKDSISIGIDTAKASLDVNGLALFRGINANPFPTQVNSGVEFFIGRNSTGTLPAGLSKADIAFSHGAASGGFRHFMTTTHSFNTNSSNNSIRFYVNNAATPAGSVSPGNGNLLQLAITAAGIGLGKEQPVEMLDVAGNGSISGKLKAGDGILVTGIASISGNTTIGGDASISGNASVNGTVSMGYVTLRNETILPSGTYTTMNLACPAGTQLIGGGGGADYTIISSYVKDVLIHYNGPSLTNPDSRWALVVENTHGSESRKVVVYCKCARIN